MGVRPCTALLVLMLFLLVFAALGFETYQLNRMKEELKELRQVQPVGETLSAQKQIGFSEAARRADDSKAAAHVTGRMGEDSNHTLRWAPHNGRGFVSGGIVYRYEDGALQVNKTGVYYVYSRVELTFKECSAETSFEHKVFVRRASRPTPLRLMEAHRAGFCTHRIRLPWTTESYLGSVLQLQEHDRVYVNISQPTFLRRVPYANFFGLYEI
ncbi:tumor necrosis factor ligand superfamily member 6-like [Xyrichtys novacula]|uniref:Tumor necrosis factor ligand superfamily member 6-like n=1 Tax=Xyrichtys novacula TaxID=13765 RepID=A0AAV1FH29_XYRNO|nr:tumor necrosis factor ligand superfamily member 6-like [Xyrichtys novacula]